MKHKKTAFYFYFSKPDSTGFLHPATGYLLLRIIINLLFINNIKWLVMTDFIHKTTVNMFEIKKARTVITEYANIFHEKYKPYQHAIIYIIDK
ncbi:MAG: hypothetical protein LBH77_04610 [Tannerella sp.]|jgi:hypothetical protein|nr:hypothetical protein [Tannerella sp.]